MRAFKLIVLSVLLAIMLVAPGYVGTTSAGSGTYGTIVPVHERYYGHDYRWGHEGHWRDYRPYGYYYRPYVSNYGYYSPYYYGGPYVAVSPAPGFSFYFGF